MNQDGGVQPAPLQRNPIHRTLMTVLGSHSCYHMTTII